MAMVNANAAVPATTVSGGGGGRRRRARTSQNLAKSGGIRINRTDLFVTLKQNDNSFRYVRPSSFTWLSNLSKFFDRWKIYSCSFEYRPSVGTTTDGKVMMGINYVSDGGNKVSKDTIAALTPFLDTPVWQSAKLVFPQNRLMVQKEYQIDSSPSNGNWEFPGALEWSVGGPTGGTKEVGDIWVTYDVELFGTNPV